MSTSPRYDSIASRLLRQLPNLRPRLLEPLSLALTGISQAVSAHQASVAATMPLLSKQSSKIQRLRRLLDNPKLTAERIYQPIVQQALTGLKHQRLQLLLDRVVLSSSQNVLVVSVGFRRRSLPLLWRVLEHQGSSSLEDQQALLTAAAALLPEGVQITLHADSEFRSLTLFGWLRSLGWSAMLGVRGNLLVSSEADRPGRALLEWLVQRDSVAYLNGVWLREDRIGPINVIGWWDTNDRGELICYGVMSDLPASWQSYQLGKRRMWIETLFRDWQSSGFGLQKSGISDHERFARLLVLVCLVYLWFVSLGRWLVKRGYRCLIDAGPAERWQWSLFTLAVAWQNRLRSFAHQMPVFWKLYL
jgi:hypothetical protein